MNRACSNATRRVAKKTTGVGARAIAGGILLGASLGVLAVGSAGATLPAARAARTIVLNETGRLHLTSKHGFALNEEGSAAGAIKGKIYLHLKIVSTNRVTAEVSIYPSGGSLTGNAAASYRVAGATASFSGTMSIARGTGRYRTAHGSGLGFNGTINRTNDAVAVRLTGKLSV
jgi:hypothetical protein